MTTDTDGTNAAADRHLDRVARALHAQAVEHVPARTLRQLRARHAPAVLVRPRPVRAFGWVAAAACAAVFAVAIGLRQEPVAPAAAPVVAADAATRGGDAPVSGNDAYADALASFDEDPGLYLWLASSDAQPLAME